MDGPARELLDRLLETATPSGYETAGQRTWLEAVTSVADDVHTDAYGNAVATYQGGTPSIVIAGHGDEIGLIVRRIDDDGFIHPDSIGGADRTVTRGQHVTLHTAAGPLQGVIGQTAIHLRDPDEDSIVDVTEQRVDIGARDGAEARELVEVGDPITISGSVRELHGERLSARGLDNRMGIWSVATAFRRIVEAGPAATVHAVSTIQEEVGLQGARMVGFDLDPDAVVAVDVTHATDHPAAPDDAGADLALGGGPVINRGSVNHPRLVEILRHAADAADIEVQLQAIGTQSSTDADAFYTQRGGVPTAAVGVPLRYMHTPVETIDFGDLSATRDLLAAFVSRAAEDPDFVLEV